MKIAVTTPTGNVGRHVVAMLLRAGVRPTVLVRDPARLDPAARERVDAAPVDQADADAVVATTRDVDALPNASPMTPCSRSCASPGWMTASRTPFWGMSTGLRDGFVPEQARSPETTTPTLASWSYANLRPLLTSELLSAEG